MKYQVCATLMGSIHIEAENENEAYEKATEIPWEDFEFEWEFQAYEDENESYPETIANKHQRGEEMRDR